MKIATKILHGKGGQPLELVVQRDCGVSVLGNGLKTGLDKAQAICFKPVGQVETDGGRVSEAFGILVLHRHERKNHSGLLLDKVGINKVKFEQSCGVRGLADECSKEEMQVLNDGFLARPDGVQPSTMPVPPPPAPPPPPTLALNPKDLVEVAAVASEEVAVAAAGVLVVLAVAALAVVDHLALEAFFKPECQSSDLLQVEMPSILGMCINTKVPGITEQYFFNCKAGCLLPDVHKYILR
ncbi:hypothetical protein llap_249 [Limosa lapponica baueri]|uniref:Uncharacterized protein n=1 Tax=Limosa lapponica baueri TaxID=1758121 RepID=A0A2I0UTJ8_LIMLA|nr:hypothetical protein llap_249 [Limosa lapponica baueri]